MSGEFIVERYLTARRIYKRRDERAHDGFVCKGVVVEPQTWAQWFLWAYGMSLDAYAKMAAENNHADLVVKLGAVRAQYRVGDRWMTAIGIPGESYDELAAALRRQFPDVEEVRPHE